VSAATAAAERAAILGIRHHGPGSARSVVAELDRLQPAMVLIEGPVPTRCWPWPRRPA
jgi:hypothetical protein